MKFDEDLAKTFMILNMKSYVGNEFKMKTVPFKDNVFRTNFDLLKHGLNEAFGKSSTGGKDDSSLGEEFRSFAQEHEELFPSL
eukprot:CAMPEP_0170564272 /NCGR_PEP_ID=MMETSP0211-20121228/71905_1 /TAXON_ID=311385 /ORGANISM="Pseudokeronopsis sp., Strain OXSARD2" /LENGTH=82 /DNA_ID=CAMNT_0010883515 /DNA_START=440 /DNA_END=685 /DNA_ORIENTATION=-